MTIKDAQYTKHNIIEYDNNPLTEALRFPLSQKQFCIGTQNLPVVDVGSHLADRFTRKLLVGRINALYLPEPSAYALYETICLNIFLGYVRRNPLDNKTQSRQFKIATNPKFRIDEGCILYECITLIGLSGRGKSEAIKKCFSLIPQVIRHTEFQGAKLCFDQIVHLHFEAPSTKTQKGFILNFLEAVDSALGSDYYEEWKNSRVSVAVLILEAKKIAFNHCLGIVFIDEIQRCAPKTAKGDIVTLEFIDSFFNAVGIPAVIAGTYAAAPLFKSVLSTARRLLSGRSFIFDKFDKNDKFWMHLVKSYGIENVLDEPINFDTELMDSIYYYTQGIPDFLNRLMKLAYEDAISSGKSKIDSDLLLFVYRTQFELLHPALEAVRAGNYGGYEDLITIANFKNGHREQAHELIDRIEEKSKNNQKRGASEEEYIDITSNKSTVIPRVDLRNLKGLSRQSIIEELKGKK